MNLRIDYNKTPKPKKPSESKISMLFKRVVVTGKIPGMSRQEVATLLIEKGAIILSAVVPSTDYLIQGNNPLPKSRKTLKAESYGIPIISYKQVF